MSTDISPWSVPAPKRGFDERTLLCCTEPQQVEQKCSCPAGCQCVCRHCWPCVFPDAIWLE